MFLPAMWLLIFQRCYLHCWRHTCCADLQLVFADFELDLKAALPQHWQLLLKGSASDASSISPHSIKLRSRLLSLLAATGNSSSTTGGGSNGRNPGSSRSSSRAGYAPQGGKAGGAPGSGASDGGGCSSSSGLDAGVPSAWAGRLQSVVEVLELAGQERGHVCESMQAEQARVQLLETNVQEVRGVVVHGVGCTLLACWHLCRRIWTVCWSVCVLLGLFG
jgi:hypothetical protein